MHAKFALVCLSIAAAPALATDTNNLPSPSTTSASQANASAKPLALRRVIAPTITETRATRMPDGSLAVICHDRPNPKARALQQARSALANPDQQP